MAQTPCRRANEGKQVTYTPSGADVAAGQVVVVGGIVGIAPVLIEDGVEGVLDLSGAWDVPKATGAITANQRLYWDSNGNPEGGDAGSGCFTTTATAGDPLAGIAAAAQASGDDSVKLVLNGGGGTPQAAVIAALTDNGGGASADGTIAAITNAANAGSADVAPVADAIKELSTKVNATIAALKAAGLMATS